MLITAKGVVGSKCNTGNVATALPAGQRRSSISDSPNIIRILPSGKIGASLVARCRTFIELETEYVRERHQHASHHEGTSPDAMLA